MSDVFISHSRRNATEAEALCAALEAADVSCWIAPRDIPAGAAWPSSIARAIGTSRVVAVLVSNEANASAEVAREVIAAIDGRRPLFPIRLQPVIPSGNLGYLLAGVQWHDAFAAGDRFDSSRVTPAVRAALDAKPEPAAVPPVALPPHRVADNVPREATALIGREADVQRVGALLAAHRLVTLTGTGGVGKTRLAVAAVRHAAERWPDGRNFVDLAAVTDGSAVAETIAAALELPESAPGESPTAVVRALRDGARVVILDNCEHVIADVARIVHRLVESTPATILATSREALRVAGEAVYPVPSLGGGAAVALFAERATAVSPDFALSAENQSAVEAIVRDLDGIPFAIELAAARIRAMAPEAIASRLQARFRLLTGGSRASAVRQQTLQATIDWSHDLLSEPERCIFRRLAVFAGGWTLDAASNVCGDETLNEWEVAEHLASLVDKSLVVHAPAENRYRFLESTRAYAQNRLDAASERETVARRHLTWFASRADAGQRDWVTMDRARWCRTYGGDLDNQRLALTSAIDERRDVAAGVRLAADLRKLWIAVARPAEGVAWCERALMAAGDDGSLVIGWLLLAICNLLAYGIHVQRRLRAATRAIEICRAHGDERGLIQALEDAAFALCETGDRARADAASAEALERARAFADPRTISHCLQARSFTIDRSRTDERRALLEEALAMSTRSQSEGERASYLLWLADLEAETGDFGAARERGTQALTAFVTIGDRAEASFCSANLCAYALEDGQVEAAEAYLLDALRFSDGELPLLSAIATQYAAEIALARGAVDDAARAKGFSDARIAALDIALGATEERSHQRLEAGLRARRDDPALERLAAEGRELTEAGMLRVTLPSTRRSSSDQTVSGSR